MAEYATKEDVKEIVQAAVEDLSGIISSFASQVDERFNKVEADIFKIQQDFAEMRRQNMEIKESLDRLANTVDGFIRRIDNYETEQSARDSQFQKLLAWARKVSEKTGIPLENL